MKFEDLKIVNDLALSNMTVTEFIENVNEFRFMLFQSEEYSAGEIHELNSFLNDLTEFAIYAGKPLRANHDSE